MEEKIFERPLISKFHLTKLAAEVTCKVRDLNLIGTRYKSHLKLDNKTLKTGGKTRSDTLTKNSDDVNYKELSKNELDKTVNFRKSLGCNLWKQNKFSFTAWRIRIAETEE